MNTPDNQDDPSRRSFLLSTGGLLTSAWLGTHWSSIAAAAHRAEEMAAAPTPVGFHFFTPGEAADVGAIAAQIVPSGATPGAREAHAVYFTDRALSTFFAGWAHDYRAGLTEFQSKFHAVNPAAASFAAATSDQQIAFLKTVDHTPFFETERMLTLLGMFSSPKYGGNYEGSGWKLMGFEDRHIFAPPFGYYDAEYTGFVPYADKQA
jgi:gluconate 2-dehydrogenase gamma chain